MERTKSSAEGSEHSPAARRADDGEVEDAVTLQLFQLSGWLEMRGLSKADEFAELVRKHGGEARVAVGEVRITLEASWYSRADLDDAAEQLRNYKGAYVNYSYDLVPTQKPALVE